MIDRYCTPEMTAIWSRQAKYDRWREVEVAICQIHHEDGLIPAEDWKQIQSKATFTLNRCDEIELETRHDLAAFVRNLEETTGPAGRWIHFGVTSYDVIDTALGMMLRDSVKVLHESGTALRDRIAQLADEHRDTPMIGRTHAIHAEPITFGFKCASWREELSRNLTRLEQVQKEVSYGKISGAVGIHAHISPEQEARICALCGLKPEPVSTQIINRDRHANCLNVLALTAAGLERIATELRNLQRTEILEVQEAFKKGQTGSSAMPHKRNPWNSETVVGLARLVRGHAHAMLESVATWHERDLTNSSLERVIFPDAFQVTHFMIKRVHSILDGLVVMPDNMQRNLRLMGDLVYSEHLMVSLIRTGLSRKEAYGIAQRHAAQAWDGVDFRSSVEADPEVNSRLSATELEEIFSLEHHLRNRSKFH